MRDEIPIAIASLGVKSVEMTAELADAWLPAFLTAEALDSVWGDALRAGAAKRDPNRAPLEVFAGGGVAIGEGLEELRNLSRPQVALYVGGMGARQKNFYNDIFSKSGYAAEAKTIQDLYLAGKKKEAEAAIPDEYLAKASLIGPEGFCPRSPVRLEGSRSDIAECGLLGQTKDERVRSCEKLRNIVDSV